MQLPDVPVTTTQESLNKSIDAALVTIRMLKTQPQLVINKENCIKPLMHAQHAQHTPAAAPCLSSSTTTMLPHATDDGALLLVVNVHQAQRPHFAMRSEV